MPSLESPAAVCWTATPTDGADEHVDQLAGKYVGQETYPYGQPGEQRVRFLFAPDRVRHVRR